LTGSNEAKTLTRSARVEISRIVGNVATPRQHRTYFETVGDCKALYLFAFIT